MLVSTMKPILNVIQRLARNSGMDNGFRETSLFRGSHGKKTKLLHGKDLHEFSFSMKLDPFKFNYTLRLLQGKQHKEKLGYSSAKSRKLPETCIKCFR